MKSFAPFQVLIRLIGADEHMFTNNVEAMQWLEGTDVLEMIVDKFSSSVCCFNLISIDFYMIATFLFDMVFIYQ